MNTACFGVSIFPYNTAFLLLIRRICGKWKLFWTDITGIPWPPPPLVQNPFKQGGTQNPQILPKILQTTGNSRNYSDVIQSCHRLASALPLFSFENCDRIFTGKLDGNDLSWGSPWQHRRCNLWSGTLVGWGINSWVLFSATSNSLNKNIRGEFLVLRPIPFVNTQWYTNIGCHIIIQFICPTSHFVLATTSRSLPLPPHA